MKPTGKRAQALIDAGYEIVKAYPQAQWFEVKKDGEEAAILCQSESCWHWFSKAHAATASGTSAASCADGGLGDAIDGDNRMRTYKLLLRPGRVPKALQGYEGVYAAMGQVAND